MSEQQEFELSSPQFEGVITLRYALNGHLTGYSCEAELSDKQRNYLFSNFPFKHADLAAFIAPTTIVCRSVVREVSFEDFWLKYAYKVKRKQAEAAWSRLSKVQKALAYDGISGYFYFISVKKQAKAHPSTYLNQEYYETNWRAEAKT